MKRLILDYFSRKKWILASGAALEFLIGCLAAGGGLASHLAMPSLSVQIAIFMVALPITFDLSRGISRTVATLPLTALQIGRAWWLATVGIPAVAISALLFLGAGASHAFYPNVAFPAKTLAMTSLFTLLWLGSGFTALFGSMGGLRGSFWQRTRNVLSGIVWGLLLGGGFIFINHFLTNSTGALVLVGLGAAMTAAGWLCAEWFVLDRTSFRREAGQSKSSRGLHRAPTGYGGLPLLLGTTFVRGFVFALAVVAATTLMMGLDGRTNSWHQIARRMASVGSSFPAWFIVIFLLVMPTMFQMRLLRSLPISATRLAATFIAIAILPLIAVGIVVSVITDLTSAISVSGALLKGFLLTLAPASIAVSFIVWQGVGTRAYVLLMAMMIGFQSLCIIADRQIPAIPTGIIVIFSVTFAFLLTRWSILNGSQTYRTQAMPFGNSAWTSGR